MSTVPRVPVVICMKPPEQEFERTTDRGFRLTLPLVSATVMAAPVLHPSILPSSSVFPSMMKPPPVMLMVIPAAPTFNCPPSVKCRVSAMANVPVLTTGTTFVISHSRAALMNPPSATQSSAAALLTAPSDATSATSASIATDQGPTGLPEPYEKNRRTLPNWSLSFVCASRGPPSASTNRIRCRGLRGSAESLHLESPYRECPVNWTSVPADLGTRRRRYRRTSVPGRTVHERASRGSSASRGGPGTQRFHPGERVPAGQTRRMRFLPDHPSTGRGGVAVCGTRAAPRGGLSADVTSDL